MGPLNYWWPLVLYRHIMYMYSRKPARLCVARCTRVYAISVCTYFVCVCVAFQQVIYKYGDASPFARTYTHGSVKSVQREERLAIPPPAPSTGPSVAPYRLFHNSPPQPLATF